VKPISSSERFQHRRSSYKELQYISDGDSNGVIYYAGTSFGKHQWMNPVLAKVWAGGWGGLRLFSVVTNKPGLIIH